MRMQWKKIVEQGAKIAQSYDTPVTLRQLFYQLVAREILPNKQSAYQQLSRRTTEARKRGDFPALVDNTRQVYKSINWPSPKSALQHLTQIYRRNRTEGQPYQVFIAVEKKALVAQLERWFAGYGIPILALGGYASQSYLEKIARHMDRRPTVLLYGGDLDPTGEDIYENLTREIEWDYPERIALLPEHVHRYNLVPQPGKATDTRAKGFVNKYGELSQTELDALSPDVLCALYETALSSYWDPRAYQQVLKEEQKEREALEGFVR